MISVADAVAASVYAGDRSAASAGATPKVFTGLTTTYDSNRRSSRTSSTSAIPKAFINQGRETQRTRSPDFGRRRNTVVSSLQSEPSSNLHRVASQERKSGAQTPRNTLTQVHESAGRRHPRFSNGHLNSRQPRTKPDASVANASSTPEPVLLSQPVTSVPTIKAPRDSVHSAESQRLSAFPCVDSEENATEAKLAMKIPRHPPAPLTTSASAPVQGWAEAVARARTFSPTYWKSRAAAPAEATGRASSVKVSARRIEKAAVENKVEGKCGATLSDVSQTSCASTEEADADQTASRRCTLKMPPKKDAGEQQTGPFEAVALDKLLDVVNELRSKNRELELQNTRLQDHVLQSTAAAREAASASVVARGMREKESKHMQERLNTQELQLADLQKAVIDLVSSPRRSSTTSRPSPIRGVPKLDTLCAKLDSLSAASPITKQTAGSEGSGANSVQIWPPTEFSGRPRSESPGRVVTANTCLDMPLSTRNAVARHGTPNPAFSQALRVPLIASAKQPQAVEVITMPSRSVSVPQQHGHPFVDANGDLCATFARDRRRAVSPFRGGAVSVIRGGAHPSTSSVTISAHPSTSTLELVVGPTQTCFEGSACFEGSSLLVSPTQTCFEGENQGRLGIPLRVQAPVMNDELPRQITPPRRYQTPPYARSASGFAQASSNLSGFPQVTREPTLSAPALLQHAGTNGMQQRQDIRLLSGSTDRRNGALGPGAATDRHSVITALGPGATTDRRNSKIRL